MDLAVRRAAAALILALAPPAAVRAQSIPPPQPTQPPKPQAPPIEQVVVTARRLDAARDRLQPSLGATVHGFSPATLAQVPQGENASLNQVLLQVPGVAQDSFGQIHVRGDHNEVQYRLDGVELPEGLAVFGQALESRFARSLDLITGALPAQYGQLQAAVVDIDTRSGTTNPGGELSLYGGARDYLQTSLSYGKRVGQWDLFVTGDVTHDRLGIENPDSSFNATHDLSNQYHALAHLSYIANDTTRVSLIAGVSNAQFQIPNNPGQTPTLGYTDAGITTANSGSLTEHQREITDFAILSLQQQLGPVDIQNAVFSRYSSLYFTPDPLADLLFTGIAQTAARSVWSSGLQSDASLPLGASHTLRAGVQFTAERGVSATQSSVFPLDPTGAQIGDTPISITNNSSKTGALYGLYLQDEWRITPKLTLNFGARYDGVDEYTSENQISPRVNLVWQPLPGTSLHAGYSHYFTPPPFELVGGNTVALFQSTSAAALSPTDSTVRAEHDNYYDAGLQQLVLPGLQLSLDGYFKTARNLIDEGQFGAPIILTAFNYARGQVSGLEAATTYANGPWSLYGNVALSRAIGKDIDTAQFSFSPAELAYISDHWVHLDHDQRWTGSGGVSYTAFRATPNSLLLSADLIVGSGLRADGTVPNGRALDGYATANLSAAQKINTGWIHGMTARLDIINLLDRAYEIRDGTGIGVGAPQYGRRRTILGGFTQRF
jgi:outer membrane receptor protein involved in Fe transport